MNILHKQGMLIGSTGIVLFLLLGTTIVHACTGFTASKDDLVLVGNNEDWYDPDPYMRIYPATEDSYGMVLFEFPWPPTNPQGYTAFGGINDQGLNFDLFLHPPLQPIKSWNKPIFQGDLCVHAIQTCATVDEVITVFLQYNLGFMKEFQMFIVDASGDAAIIEGDEIIHKEGTFMVVTNFLQSNPEHGWYPCWRYDTAVAMLEEMTELSVDYFRDICEATHQEGAYPTVYSNIYDVTHGMLYLYHYYDYDNAVVFDVNEELSMGAHSYYIPKLFRIISNNPPETPEKPDGPPSGKTRRQYTFTTATEEPDDDLVFYCLEWGDESPLIWQGPYQSGETASFTHSWTTDGSYTLRVKAKDLYGDESEWSEPLSISIPKTKDTGILGLLQRWHQQYPFLQEIMNIMTFLPVHR
jgi:hypothetical protein